MINIRKSIFSIILFLAIFFCVTETKGEVNTDLSNPITSNGVVTWDTVYFGNYWQNDTNKDGYANKEDKKEPIRWRVLSIKGNDLFLLAENNLDCKPFHDVDGTKTWETCSLRTWLNGNFVSYCFSEEEKEAIKITDVEDNDNITQDMIFLLSKEEASARDYGFYYNFKVQSDTREAKNTFYAIQRGATYCRDKGDYLGNGEWWTRSTEQESEYANVAYYVTYNKNADTRKARIRNEGYAVRPALHLDLSKVKTLQKAGKVTAKTADDYNTIIEETITPISTKTPVFVPIKIDEEDDTAASQKAPPKSTPTNKLTKPVITVKKKKSGTLRYIQIKLKKYKGTYINIYFSKNKKDYKLVSKNVKIKKHKRGFNFAYKSKKSKYWIKVRTYSKSGKKKKYSEYSKVMLVRT